MLRIFPWLLLFLATASAQPLRVSAAASLSEVLKEAAALFEKSGHGPIILNLGGSNLLARQIAEGAPADVFLSADLRTMEELRSKELILTETQVNLASNALVVIVPQSSALDLEDAAGLASPSVRRIAMGDPAAVPAGVYARLWLEHEGVWEKVQPKIVGTENVRGALAAVEGANADAAIVYRTDAAISRKVRIALTAPAANTPTIVYPAAVCRTSKAPESAREWLAFLRGKNVRKLFENHGFSPPPNP